ncbi:hypothetical protein ACFQHO_28235 [Actinomadura yumaensis]|uniref:hypothetical protein n=1 Tax=Actinomadura yumaensis TaxID=111807 RepID=UPI0036243F23
MEGGERGRRVPGAAWIGGVDMYAKTPGSWHWDGARWTRVDVPFDGPFAGRMAVAAEPGGTAWGLLTGFYRNPLDDRVFRFEGGRWVQQDVPLPPQETTELTSIAAGSAENVWIAGVTSDGQGAAVPFTLRWDGTRWQRNDLSGPYRDVRLGAVTRRHAWAFTTAGSWQQGTEERRLWRFARGGWSAVADVPHVGGGARPEYVRPVLDGRGRVWTPGAGAGRSCYQHWDGTEWRTVYGPERDAAARCVVHDLVRVPGTRSLWAVGEDETNARPFAERWG